MSCNIFHAVYSVAQTYTAHLFASNIHCLSSLTHTHSLSHSHTHHTDFLALQNSAAANAAAAKSRAPVATPRAKTTRAIARSNYTAQSTEEVGFKVRDTVDVLEKADNGWWFIRNGTKEGW